MVLISLLARLAARRPRCYVVEAPGGAAVRRAVEAALDRRGWRPAVAPAHADALVVAGDLPEALHEPADLLWSQVPGPRARLDLSRVEDVEAALDALPGSLADVPAQARDAGARADEASRWTTEDEGGEDHGGHGGHDEHGGHEEHEEHGGHGDHAEHGGHDHGHMAMSPSGIPLAEGTEDRDGLEMDVLVHPLGPLLPNWPGGLEVSLRLHGDLVTGAESHWWGEPRGEGDPVVERWDAVATTLALAGDDRHARLARDVRDGDPAEADRVTARVRRLARVGVLPAAAGTVLRSYCTDPTSLDHRDPVDPGALVHGRDFADARLVLAAYAPLLRSGPDE